ncbi:MAG: ABC transporter ATP-binding protein, partial [Cyclobacteriaceae bacterium]
MFFISNVVVSMNPLFYGWFVNELQQQGSQVIHTAWIYVIGFMGLRLLEWGFHGPARVMEGKLAFQISRNFQQTLYHNVLQLPMQWHQENHSGATINKTRKAQEALKQFFHNGFIYLYSFGKLVFSVGAMLYFSPLFGSIGIGLGIITIILIFLFDKVFIKTLREVNEREHVVSAALFDTLLNITTVITLRLEKTVHSHFIKKVSDVFPAFKKNITVNELKWFTAQMMVGTIYAVTVFGYVYQHLIPGQIFPIAGMIILIGYVTQFTSVFNDIASQYTQILKFDTEVRNVAEIEKAFDQKPVLQPAAPLPIGWKEIHIHSLNFVRPRSPGSLKRTGLFDFGMHIKKDHRVALIGQSGSGKSTVLTLLRGLQPAISGARIIVDDMNDATLESIASKVTLFPQEPEIFENTILYNITLGVPYAKDEILKVCDDAQFTEVLSQMPEGLNTFIQEKGVNLSGGQKQRLALARGILAARDSEIILLDEPTSSIDPQTEKSIYYNIFKTFRQKAVICSLHRLHLLTEFDYVYILKDGSVIDEGTFDDLKRYSLVFQGMWGHQKAKAEKDVIADAIYPVLNAAL